MLKMLNGRWPKWLRSFRFRLIFFSALTIILTISILGLMIFTLFTSLEIDRVDKVIISSLDEMTSFYEKAGRLPAQLWHGRSCNAVFQVYGSDLSLLFHLPPGFSAPPMPPELLTEAVEGRKFMTFDPRGKRFLPKLWWILPWNFLSDRDMWRTSVRTTSLSGLKVYLVSMVPLESILVSRHLLFWMISLAGLGGIILSLVVGSIVAGQAMKPLKSINRSLSKVSISNMSINPPPGETDREIIEIVAHINSMLKNLDQGMKNLQQFTSDASHELRTPLAVMRGAVDVALLRERDGPYYISKLQDLIYNIESMQNLVGALLELARLDDLKGLEKMEPVDLLIVAEDAVDNIKPLAYRRGQTLESRLEPAPTRGREAMLLRLASNLLDNASKHSPPGSRIGIGTFIDGAGSRSVLEVKDTGPGLSAEEIERCFDRFWRADSSRTTPGFGLGLPLVQRIAQLHNGSVEIESKRGEGSVFRVHFPLDAESLKEYDLE
jgi:signal transduction histidine kinase